VHHCKWFPGLLFLGLISQGLSDMLKWSSNGSGVTGQAPTQLKIATQLARNLAIKLATICDI